MGHVMLVVIWANSRIIMLLLPTVMNTWLYCNSNADIITVAC